MARTISPVLEPWIRPLCLGFPCGKPNASTLHTCLQPCPLAVMNNGCTPAIWIVSGVLLPTQAVSIQSVFGSSLVVRLYLVSPPEPHSLGNPRACNFSKRAQRVVFTAAASLKGALVCAKIFVSRSGFAARKSLISFVPLAMLHFSQARQRFEILLEPPLALGSMCSIWRATSCFPQ